MSFIISSTFTDSLAALDADAQARIKQSAFDFQLNPEHPSFQFHRIERAREKNFWSFRVSRDLRIIVYKKAATFMLCYADHHDAAYAWAERRKIDIHPQTGAAQLIELRERVEEVVQRIYTQLEHEPPLFERYQTDYLLALGVPEEWLDAVLTVGESGFLELIEVLPEEAAEYLMQLAQGQPVARPSALKVDDPFIHPDAQRRFKVVGKDEALLRQALDAPWDKWVTFLHPSQRALVERRYSGPARATGGAGTGKTVVALHRAAHLASAYPGAKVLLTTFSKTLAARLKANMQLLKTAAPRAAEVQVDNLHSVAAGLWEAFTGQPFKPLSERELDLLLGASIVGAGATAYPLGFVRAEWLSVIDEQGIKTWEAYKSASRAGRGSPLGIRQRHHLWQVFERTLAACQRQQAMSFNMLCYALADLLNKLDTRPFSHIVADEVQDFGAAELKLLRALVGVHDDDIFLCGDMGQRIYKAGTSFLANGIDIRGRSSILRLNYRTTEQIRRYADKILPLALDSGDGEEEARQTVSLLNGEVPRVEACAHKAQEIDTVASFLRNLLASGHTPRDIAIFARTNNLLSSRAVAVAERLNVPYQLLADDSPIGHAHLSLGTMHRAKGLEFKVVIIMGCDASKLPLDRVLKRLSIEGERTDFIAKERNLLYVACTRAREILLLSGVAPLSYFVQ